MEKQKRIALFNPWIKSKGGAERVVLEILKNKKYKVDIYTWVYDEEKTFEEFKKFKINIIAPKIAKKLSRYYLLRGLFFPLSLFSKIPLEKYDIFLIYSSGMGELITFRNYKPKKTYAYINTPLRASCNDIVSWNIKYRYKTLFSKFKYMTSIKIYNFLEKIAWKRIDRVFFISNLSLKRAEKKGLMKNKKTYVIYPPVDIEKFRKIKTKTGDYFLYVSRFNPPKRQDLLIKAWIEFVKSHQNCKLVLVGNIENKKYFEKIKKLVVKTKNIEIKTNLNDKETLELYANCLAVVFIPFMEDFGIVPFEALAIGKPLIAVDEGGYVKLIEKIPQVFWINEKSSEELMIKEINNALERFLKSNIRAKKIKIKDLESKSFTNKLEKYLKTK